MSVKIQEMHLVENIYIWGNKNYVSNKVGKMVNAIKRLVNEEILWYKLWVFYFSN
jgi:hypothetical protein